MNREWAMPNKNTFAIKPIELFVNKYLAKSDISIDPFARDSSLCTYTNDLNPETCAQYHEKANDFLQIMVDKKINADLVILDPPYSLRQTKECYDDIGVGFNRHDSNNASWKPEKDFANKLLRVGGIAISFGWNSNGMGIKRGYEIQEILLVAHGGGHYDTICVAEKKVSQQLFLFTP